MTEENICLNLCPAKTQVSLHRRAGWPEFLLGSASLVASLGKHQVDSVKPWNSLKGIQTNLSFYLASMVEGIFTFTMAHTVFFLMQEVILFCIVSAYWFGLGCDSFAIHSCWCHCLHLGLSYCPFILFILTLGSCFWKLSVIVFALKVLKHHS